MLRILSGELDAERFMKICPVCNDTFADALNFCDVDGTRLTQAGGTEERSKWWSLVGAGLLIGALVISAASIFFLPRSRVPTPVVSSEPTPATVTPKPSPTVASETTASAATPAAGGEPETASPEALAPEVKRRDRTLSNSNSSSALPNPKAAAIAAEEGDKKPAIVDPSAPVSTTPKKPEPQNVKAVTESHSGDPTIKPQTPPDPKKDPKAQVAAANHEKDSKDKKKDEEKKKGGFLKVFKKIFGKD
jgi:hypothetical protein